MKKFDEKDPHFKMCVAKVNAIKKQKEIIARMEGELDAEIDRQHDLSAKRAAAIKELENKKPVAKKPKK